MNRTFDPITVMLITANCFAAAGFIGTYWLRRLLDREQQMKPARKRREPQNALAVGGSD